MLLDLLKDLSMHHVRDPRLEHRELSPQDLFIILSAADAFIAEPAMTSDLVLLTSWYLFASFSNGTGF